jgi:hypothetical protein
MPIVLPLTPLPLPPTPAIPPAEASTPGPTYCSNCGAGNPPGSNFCTACGKSLK